MKQEYMLGSLPKEVPFMHDLLGTLLGSHDEVSPRPPPKEGFLVDDVTGSFLFSETGNDDAVLRGT